MRFVALLALTWTTLAAAQPRVTPQVPPAGSGLTQVATAEEVMKEVNGQRAQRGLPPFIYDEKLAQGAYACAVFRALRGIEGHTSNDFSFLPPGTHASAAGCAAWPQGMGFGACCLYEAYRYAGAAFCIGRDGRRYMHLFVVK